MKKLLLVLLCLIVSVASAEQMNKYISAIEHSTDTKARVIPAASLVYNTRLLFNFQDSSLLLASDDICYAWEDLSRSDIYDICNGFLEEFSKYDNLSISILQEGESEIHVIDSNDEAKKYIELLQLAHDD